MCANSDVKSPQYGTLDDIVNMDDSIDSESTAHNIPPSFYLHDTEWEVPTEWAGNTLPPIDDHVYETWPYCTVENAAYHLKMLQRERANGRDEWTPYVATWAAKGGHLETLRWILASGGPTTDVMHPEVIQWREGTHPIQQAASTIVEVLYQWNPYEPSEGRFPPHLPELVTSYIRLE